MTPRTLIGVALLTFTVGLALIFQFLDDAPMHAMQEFGVAAVIAWMLPERKETT
jgi:hypothetical protein